MDMKKIELITLQTAHTTYQMGVTPEGFLLQLYYGPKTDDAMDYLLTRYDRGFEACPNEMGTDRTFSMGVQPAAFPVYGNGDYRTPAFSMKDGNGVYGCDLRYVSHEVREGKYEIPGLPAAYAGESKAQTVDILLRDALTGTEVTLRYGLLPELDVITRSLHVENKGQGDVYLERAASASLDLVSGEYDLIHFYGHHGMERITERTALHHGVFAIGSKRGTSSHQHNPFVVLADRAADEDKGSCYGFSFLYSGNFSCEAEVDSMNQTRIVMGLQPEMFSWRLAPGECFDTPEMMMAYTDQGFAALSHIFHKAIRHHVVRGPHRIGPRPVLINNWEATYFDFTGEKLIDIAREAKSLGVEMMVLDDGWFGHRDSDFEGLGDWWVNEEKLGMSMAQLGEKIHALGMKFGLWIEPEMVNEDTDLYKNHPDWVYQIPGRAPVRSRSQLCLDFSRTEVVDYIFEQIAAVVKAGKVDYIKMDLNRNIYDVYTHIAGWQNSGMILHRYVLGVYRFIQRLLDTFPQILIEGCSGGGGRFDAGMLYYTPQIWCSDCSDPVERLQIQYGTSFGYPVSSVGAHVSTVPNHQTGRITPFETRAAVAMAGSFGYELDLNLITEEEKAAVKQQIIDYKRYQPLIYEGLYYRLLPPDLRRDVTAWSFVKEDGSEALMWAVVLNPHCNSAVTYVRFKGLDPDRRYRINDSERTYSGQALMKAGWPIPALTGEYRTWLYHLTACE